MIDGSKYRIPSEIIFTKCKAKYRNEEHIFCDSMLLAEILYLLHRNLRNLSVISRRSRNCSVLIRIEAYASTLIFKYRFIVVLCIFIGITLQGIAVIQCKIIGGILFCLQLFSAVSPVDIIQDNTKGRTVCDNMMNIKEQIISVTGSVNFKPEKLIIKQHIRTDQRFPVHSIDDLCLAA